MKLTWLNQGGFLFEIAKSRLVVDGYLSDIVEREKGWTRLVESPMTLDELRPDYWLCTHDHLDHFDPPTISEAIKKFPGCRFIGPSSVQRHLKKVGASDEQMMLLSDGDNCKIDNFEINAVSAIHSDPDAIGIIIKADGLRIYLSGDTEYPSNVFEFTNKLFDIDIMFICINGKLGNMNYQEAIKIVEMIKPQLAVPIHYDLFAENAVSPVEFLNACKGIDVNAVTLESGRMYTSEELLK